MNSREKKARHIDEGAALMDTKRSEETEEDLETAGIMAYAAARSI